MNDILNFGIGRSILTVNFIVNCVLIIKNCNEHMALIVQLKKDT